jgi:hypothetical protein
MPKYPLTIYPIILYKYFASECLALAWPLARPVKVGLISQIGRQHIGYAVFNRIAFLAGLAAELARYNLFLVLLEYLKCQVAFAERAG